MGASRRRNPGLKVELNPLDCWAAGPCSVLVDYVDFGSLATGPTLGEFQAFGEELSSLPGIIDYSKLNLLAGLLSAKSVMNELMKLLAPFRLPKIVLQAFPGRNERASPAARPNASL
ncbi:hypothetical protein TURU_086205 [Turdus rufiventris]|nr:hypothetical protein TURU_086205 [Turdus rufiventris]